MARYAENDVIRLTYSKSKISLWDPTPNGDAFNLHLSNSRNPKLLLSEKVLRLAHRHAQQGNKPQFTCFLLGNIVVDADEEGVTVALNRFDLGREELDTSVKIPTALLPGDILVPCIFGTQELFSADNVFHAAEDQMSFKMLRHYCCSREPLDLAKMLILRAHLCGTQHTDTLDFVMRWAAITVANTINTLPIKPIPIIPTALARNLTALSILAQPLNSVNHRRGFLTMDQTRKLLLMFESDPKAYTLPLVGVWLSGVTHVSNPQVWAWCLKYLFSFSFKDRVMSENGCFLVVLYSLTHREPDFYQCNPGSNEQKMDFQLLTCTKSFTLLKNAEMSEGLALQFELSAESKTWQKLILFSELVFHPVLTSATKATVGSPLTKISASEHDSGVVDEDLSPRPSPNPHPLTQQTNRVHPSVPELSLVMEGSFMVGSHITGQSHNAPTPDVQQTGSNSAYYAHSEPRHPDQVAPLTESSPIRRPLMVVAHQDHQQSLSFSKKSKSLFRKLAKDGCTQCLSSLSSSVALNHKHFQSTPNSNLNVPCSCIYTQLDDRTPIHHPNVRQGSSPTSQPQVNCLSPFCLTHPNQNTECLTIGPQTHTFSAHTECTPINKNGRGCFELPPPFDYLKQCQDSSPVATTLVDQQYVVGPTGILPTDAYQILQDQDRQLKFLQAQIRKLLECQEKPVCQLPSTEETAIQSNQTFPGQLALNKVNIAVETGASLFWGDPDVPSYEECSQQDWHADFDPDVPDANILEDMKEQHVSGSPSNQSMQRYGVVHGSSCCQSPKLGESASMYCQPLSPEREIPVRQDTRKLKDEHMFYQQLLGQVNSRLQDTVNEELQKEAIEHSSTSILERHSLSSEGFPCESSSNYISGGWKPASSSEHTDMDHVFSATLQQLKQLGVNMELDSANAHKATRVVVETASTLAYISPEAVLPRLTLPKVMDANMCSLTGSGDLSLEANAIAYKYLNDSQLARMSSRPKLRPNVTVLSRQPSADISPMGLSLFSPSNMSMATQKYMKRYGLIEGNSNQEMYGKMHGTVIVEVDQVHQQEQKKGFVQKKNYSNELAPSSGALFSQSQNLCLQRQLCPKTFFNHDTKSSQEKNSKQLLSLREAHEGSPLPEGGSVGNFLDLSRLHQLPKLF
ncbi:SCL-interrupting locus protein homolog isoform X1 [Osmerus mordax]|uniref:SCL-interrupting locus protein homolog isoform X1 n=1 Tax=Osmerus mordax TaxID=8014 RepID=UPI003510676C